MIVPVLKLGAPDESRSVMELLYSAESELFPGAYANWMRLRQCVANAQLLAVAELAESHRDVGSVQVVDGVNLNDLIDLGVPGESPLCIRYEACEFHSMDGSLHGYAEPLHGGTQSLEVVNFVDMMHELSLVALHLLPPHSFRGWSTIGAVRLVRF